MHPDGSMPVQGSSLAAGSRQLRMLGAGIVGLGLLVLASRHAPRPADSVIMESSPPVCQCAYSYSPDDQIIALCRMGRQQEAVAVADQVLAGMSRTPHATWRIRFLRAGALRLLGRETDARADYALAADLMGNGEVSIDMQLQSGNAEAVRTLALKTIATGADDPCGLNNACWELAMAPGGDPEMAARLMAPLAIHSDDPFYIDTYAWSLYLSGQKQAAIEQEMRAVRFAGIQGGCDLVGYQACLAGMLGDSRAAAGGLRRLFQNDISSTDFWTAAQHFAGPQVQS